jgi:nitroimidazol reductase NimA-like FMN-containing flavoprotein (pyridoxamine 5'-phosphate oxidase superfamily)
MANTTQSDDDGRPPAEPVVEALPEAECLQLLAGPDIGRIAFTGRFGITVLPVNYRLHDGSIVFRTGEDSPMDTDLRTGLEHGEYQVAFEVDEIEASTREGWSVLIRGPAHHVTTAEERAAVAGSGVAPWTGGSKEQFIRILPTQISGRRIRNPGRT